MSILVIFSLPWMIILLRCFLSYFMLMYLLYFQVIFECKPNNLEWPRPSCHHSCDDFNYRAGALACPANNNNTFFNYVKSPCQLFKKRANIVKSRRYTIKPNILAPYIELIWTRGTSVINPLLQQLPLLLVFV